MNDKRSTVLLFIDDQPEPVAELAAPVQFELDTRKLTDGEHVLRIVSRSPAGREGMRTVKFEVRNGPAIAVEGLSDKEVVEGVLPLLINAYDKGEQKHFLIAGSETPRSIPSWLWIMIVVFFGWAAFYLFSYVNLH